MHFINEDENENVDAWSKLATWEKSTYNQIANSYNHEQEYETVRYIEDENERKHTLNQKINELKHLVITFTFNNLRRYIYLYIYIYIFFY